MELFEIVTKHKTYERKTYQEARDLYDSIDLPAALYVVREPGGECDLIDEKPKTIRHYPQQAIYKNLIILLFSLTACGCSGNSNEIDFLAMMLICTICYAIGIVTGYIIKKRIYTERELRLMRAALMDNHNFREQLSRVKAENIRIRNQWAKIFSGAKG